MCAINLNAVGLLSRTKTGLMVSREQNNRAECGYLDQFPVRICKWLPYLNINLAKIIIAECCARLHNIIKFNNLFFSLLIRSSECRRRVPIKKTKSTPLHALHVHPFELWLLNSRCRHVFFFLLLRFYKNF